MVKSAEEMLGDDSSIAEGCEDLRASAKEVYDHLCENMAHMKEMIQDKAEMTDQKIKEHPYSSLAIAAGVGLLVGLCLKRHH